MFAGIDGGASNTRIKLVGEYGMVKAASVPGPSSLTLSVEGAWERIAEALALVGVGPDLYPQLHLACALAGTRRAAAQSDFAALAPNFASLALCSTGMRRCWRAGRPGLRCIFHRHGHRGQLPGNRWLSPGQIGGWGFPGTGRGQRRMARPGHPGRGLAGCWNGYDLDANRAAPNGSGDGRTIYRRHRRLGRIRHPRHATRHCTPRGGGGGPG